MRFSKIVIVIFVLFYVLFTGLSFAKDEKSSCDLMISNFSLDVETINVENLVKEFCVLVSKNTCVDDNYIFDANQSVFLTVLCDNVGKGDLFDGVDRGEDGILLKTGFEQFGIVDYGFGVAEYGDTIDFCDYKQTNMNACDLSKKLPIMFNEIINDYFNIKQAHIYGVDQLDENVSDYDIANNYSLQNFPGLGSLNKLEEGICDPDSDYYTKTCEYLKNYMGSVKSLLQMTSVIDVASLSLDKDEGFCDESLDKNMLYCGLLGHTVVPEVTFLNVVYNEYLRYRLFISYYSYELSIEPMYSEFKSLNVLDKIENNREKIYSFHDQVYKTRESISMTLRVLSEISNSFALHIGFLMYQEDAMMFMKKLSKLYSPIMTLYDKFRNVQKMD